MQRRIFTLLLTSVFGLSAIGLSGCGVKGELQTPPPLWGDKDNSQTPEDQTSEGQAPEGETQD